jgi:hypothetical protein
VCADVYENEVGKVILTFGLANKDHIKMMEPSKEL